MALTSAGCMLYAKIKHVPEKKRAAYTGLCTYPNCTFIGMPLCIALMGEWGTLYGAAMAHFSGCTALTTAIISSEAPLPQSIFLALILTL